MAPAALRSALRLGTAAVCGWECWEIVAHRKWTVTKVSHVARNSRLGSSVIGFIIGGLCYHLLLEAE